MQVFTALQVNQEPFRIEESARVWMSTVLSPPVINHYPISPPAKSGKDKIRGIESGNPLTAERRIFAVSMARRRRSEPV
jgi:hypothetical protein